MVQLLYFLYHCITGVLATLYSVYYLSWYNLHTVHTFNTHTYRLLFKNHIYVVHIHTYMLFQNY